jgi:hypothetical protein
MQLGLFHIEGIGNAWAIGRLHGNNSPERVYMCHGPRIGFEIDSSIDFIETNQSHK